MENLQLSDLQRQSLRGAAQAAMDATSDGRVRLLKDAKAEFQKLRKAMLASFASASNVRDVAKKGPGTKASLAANKILKTGVAGCWKAWREGPSGVR